MEIKDLKRYDILCYKGIMPLSKAIQVFEQNPSNHLGIYLGKYSITYDGVTISGEQLIAEFIGDGVHIWDIEKSIIRSKSSKIFVKSPMFNIDSDAFDKALINVLTYKPKYSINRLFVFAWYLITGDWISKKEQLIPDVCSTFVYYLLNKSTNRFEDWYKKLPESCLNDYINFKTRELCLP